MIETEGITVVAHMDENGLYLNCPKCGHRLIKMTQSGWDCGNPACSLINIRDRVKRGQIVNDGEILTFRKVNHEARPK